MSADDTNPHPPPTHTWRALSLDEHRQGDFAIVSFLEEDLRKPEKADLLRAEFEALLAHVDESRFVIDFTGVTRVTSGVLGAVMKFAAQARAEGRRVAACCLAPDLRRAFELLNHDQILPVGDTRREAVHLTNEPEAPRRRWWWPFG